MLLVEELVRGVAAVELVEHLAVADEEDAPGAARGLHGVRDHEDRLPAAVHLAEETQQLVRGRGESSAPVGSSASRMRGFVMSARATAARCFWPPETS